MTRIGYYMRTSTYLQNTDRQEEKVEKGWKLDQRQGLFPASDSYYSRFN